MIMYIAHRKHSNAENKLLSCPLSTKIDVISNIAQIGAPSLLISYATMPFVPPIEIRNQTVWYGCPLFTERII